MVAAEVETLTAISDGPNEHRLVRTEVVTGIGPVEFLGNVALDRYKIENGGRESADRAALLMCHVPCHGECLQIDLRGHDRRPEAKHNAAFQSLDTAGKNQEITIARSPQRRSIAVRMLVQNVVADADVNSRRYRAAPCRGENTEIAMREIAGGNTSADVFSKSQSAPCGFLDHFVEFSRFAPKPEFARLNIARDALGGCANARELPVVNRSRSVERDMGQHATLEQINEMAVYSSAQHVRSHDQNARGVLPSRGGEALRNRSQLRVLEGRRRIVQRKPS